MARKVIDRVVYDTEKAEVIHDWWNGHSTTDFSYCSEVLYKTKKGNFFLCGDGGPMSKYAVALGNNSTGSSSDNITPLSKEQAIAWLEHHGGDEKILELFPDDVEEG